MSALADPVVDVDAGDRLARRNALVLAATQALAGGNNTVLVATAGIVGTVLAPYKGLATLPISVFVLGMWMATLPVGALARRFGRRNALQIGTACGVLTGLICCLAVLQGSFLLFNVGAVFGGFYAAAHQSYRFAAADTASEAFRPKAIPGCCSAASSPASSARNSSSRRRICGRLIFSPPPISGSPRSP
jgi:MFS family permease